MGVESIHGRDYVQTAMSEPNEGNLRMSKISQGSLARVSADVARRTRCSMKTATEST